MTKAQELGQLVVEKLPMFTQSSDLEVQERVWFFHILAALRLFSQGLHHILATRNALFLILFHTLLIQKGHFDSFKGVVFLTPRRPLQESHFDFFWVVKSHFNPLNRVILTTHFKMTLERVRKQINFTEVSFYTDLELFRLLFGIDVSFWPNVGVKTTPHWRSKDVLPNNSVEMTAPGQNDSFEFTVYIHYILMICFRHVLVYSWSSMFWNCKQKVHFTNSFVTGFHATNSMKSKTQS